ncbi:MAG: tRNA-dihydrouridine synthase family protein, partial [Verrucomicrobia bacterium]|nr:tRNA-dihydrouridine synthase family protein [Verrucomicrobiota bacterium]
MPPRFPLPGLAAGAPLPSALAPMQDVTGLPFMRLLGKYGPPDLFFTEYFRVHAHSTPEKWILDSLHFHGTGKPVYAQLIGEDLFHLRRTARLLQQHPVAGIDLNLGCPAPKVYRKNVGGGLLRELEHVDRVFGTLREICECPFTVKTRIGFDDDQPFAEVCRLAAKHDIDGLSVHGRTVRQMYRGEIDPGAIRSAAEALSCPVFANGNITSVEAARAIKAATGCKGVMIGRSAIRNPFLFRQIREYREGRPVFQPRLRDVRTYVEDLWSFLARPDLPDRNRLNRMKKFLNFVGQSVDAEGGFLREMRRARTSMDFFTVCDHWLAS